MKTLRIYTVLLLGLSVIGCAKPRVEKLDPHSKVLAFGDSLTAGLGTGPGESYPAILEKMLGCQVINSGVSGEDTEAGLVRLPAALEEHQPQLVILCSGGNDMLNHQPNSQTEDNLRKMIETIHASGADILMIGVPRPGLLLRVPKFYRKLSKEYELPYEGGLLAEILSNGSLKSDYIHPNEEGYQLMAERIHSLIKASEN